MGRANNIRPHFDVDQMDVDLPCDILLIADRGMLFIDAVEHTHNVTEPVVGTRLWKIAIIDIRFPKDEGLRIESLEQLFRAVRNEPDSESHGPGIIQRAAPPFTIKLDSGRLRKLKSVKGL